MFKNKNNKTKSLMMFLIAITLVTISTITAYAASLDEIRNGGKNSIGKEVYIGQLQGVPDLYCVTQPKNMKPGNYKVFNYVKIEGKVATGSNGKSIKSNENAKLAYILGGGSNSVYGTGEGYAVNGYSIRQRAIWRYMDIWVNKVGSDLGVNWQIGGGTPRDPKNLINEAEQYAKSDFSTASIKSLVGKQITTSNTMAGPFKVSYNGKITSIIVKDKNGKEVKSGISFYADKEGKTKLDIGQIASKKAFYIKNTTGETLKEITIKVEATGGINAELWFLKNPKTVTMSQRLMLVKTSQGTTQDALTIGIKTLGSLTINKEDLDTKQKLNGAEFKLKTSKGWLTGKKNETHSYTSDVNKAEKYKIENGSVTISNLQYGTYLVYEVKAPDGYKIEEQARYDGKNKWAYIGSTKVTSEGNATVKVYNENYGTIVIRKVDSKDSKKRLVAGFKIYSEEYKGWVKEVNGKYTYKNSEKDATTFRTDETGVGGRLLGRKTIKLLEFGTYKIYETEAPTGYILEEQPGYKDGKIFIKEVTLTAKNNLKKVEFTHKNVPVEPKPGNLIISKVDKDTGAKLEAGFIIKTPDGGWLKGSKKEEYVYNDTTRSEDKIYYTTGGEKLLTDLKEGDYEIYEVKAPAGYELAKQEGYDSTNDWVFAGKVTITSGNTSTNPLIVKNKKEEEPPQPEVGQLTISKIDKDTGAKLEAGFIIKTPDGGWLKGNNSNEYVYNDTTRSDDKIYYSTNGERTLTGLKYGDYEVYEVKAPTGYELAKQENYNATNDWVYVGKVTINSTTPNPSPIVARNKKETPPPPPPEESEVSISGYVWEENPGTKANDYNSLADNYEKRISGISVRLINKTNNQAVATTTTDGNGAYTFSKVVKEDELANYYVEFNYPSYKRYIPVAFNSDNANGSRALVNQMPSKENEIPTTATTYMGTSDEQTYGLSGTLYKNFFNSDTKTLENINLGIKAIPETEYTIQEDLEYVLISMKGYTYKYQYGRKGNTQAVAAPQVSWQSRNSISAYARPIYPSDIAYDKQSANQVLNVYVAYRIDITNSFNYDVEELYQEQKLHINSVTNEFDSNRYELHDNNWTVNGKTATMNEDYLKDIKETGINKEKTATKFIEFSVKRDAIHKILENPNGIIEEFPTTAKTVGYHEYTRKDYTWSNNLTQQQTHYTSSKPAESSAPYLIFKLGEERNITGKVFEDKVVTTNGEKLGNGTYDDDENIAKGVKVELLDETSVSHLYKVDRQTKQTSIVDAITTTDEHGNFILAGVVPGDYYLRFTYGDGTQKIVDASGNEKTISGKEYKSTIVTSNVAKDALINGSKVEDTKHRWYKTLEGTNYSVAVDNLDTRRMASTSDNAVILAGTPKISITVENDKEDDEAQEVNEDAEVRQDATNANGQQLSLIVLNKTDSTTQRIYNGFNFGIIEQPRQKVKVDKIITNMKLTNAQGNVIFDGNPATTKMPGVADLDNLNNENGSAYVRAEINEELVYGSTLNVKYNIMVTNISDVNYIGDNYYFFGNKDGAIEVGLKLNEVTDYLQSSLKFLSISQDKIATQEEANGQTTTAGETTIIKITGWDKVLYTINNKERTDKPTSDSVDLEAERILSTQDNDLEVINEAQVTNMEASVEIPSAGTTGSLVAVTANSQANNVNQQAINGLKTINSDVVLGEASKAVATVTPPTGNDMLTPVLYIITGTIALAVMSAGVVFIKKKVL